MDNLKCPHCQKTLSAFSLPDNTGWQTDFHIACFNDDCSYYRHGWEQMEERFGVKSSYRYRIDPATGKASPLAVWSPEALRTSILEAQITVSEATA
jgi:hypothetical protein